MLTKKSKHMQTMKKSRCTTKKVKKMANRQTERSPAALRPSAACLVEWPRICGVAIEEVSMDVADIKPVKATLLEECDIEWWLQQARCQKKARKSKNGRRRNREKEAATFLYQPARRRKITQETGVNACVREKGRDKRRKTLRTKKVVKLARQEVNCRVYNKKCLLFDCRYCVAVWGEIIGWGIMSVLTSSLVRGRIA